MLLVDAVLSGVLAQQAVMARTRVDMVCAAMGIAMTTSGWRCGVEATETEANASIRPTCI